MQTVHVPSCDCCGLPITPHMGEHCLRCGYPIEPAHEERFLNAAVHDLHRVATFGGAQMTVAALITRYQQRLYALSQSIAAPTVPSADAVLPTRSAPAPLAAVSTPVAQPVVQPAQSVARPLFSWRTFFAQQTINIVASLGAFFVLIGALSFVVTTTNLLLSFLVLFLAHALFGVTGAVFYRFQSLRTVAVIYTAIFALLVPLVGFSAYRLVVGHFIQLSPPTLVAIAALYAALVYGLLAIYQKFQPFGYLAAAALFVADLALANALQLQPEWWPVALMLLAFPLLLCTLQRNNGWPLRGGAAILRQPMQVLMYTCVVVCCLGIVALVLECIVITVSYPYSDVHHLEPAFQVSLVVLAFLLLSWTALLCWLGKRPRVVVLLPYLFLGWLLACAYALAFQLPGYALLLTGVALLYHVLTRTASTLLRRLGALTVHMEGIALVGIGIAVSVLAPSLSLLVPNPTYPAIPLTGETLIKLFTMLVGLALSFSFLFSHTRWQRVPAKPAWVWLLVFNAYLLHQVYSTLTLMTHVTPVWSFLGLTLVLMAVAVVVRRSVGSTWANPLDVIVLAEIAITLLLSLTQSAGTVIALCCLFAVLLYAVLFYQSRSAWLFLPVLIMVLVGPLLISYPRLMFSIALVLPLAAATIRLLFPHTSSTTPKRALSKMWEWPLFVIGIGYGVVLALHDSVLAPSTVQSWLGLTCSLAGELAILALVWYVAAALAQVGWWLVLADLFAVWALLQPANPFWVLAAIAAVAVLLAVGISRRFSKVWAHPCYIIAVLAAISMGVAGFAQGPLSAALWLLLAFALLIYLVGILEDSWVLRWLAPLFALWSVADAFVLHNLAYPFIIVLGNAVMGLVISRGLRLVPVFSKFTPRKLLVLALPCYATALVALLVLGQYGISANINYPSPAQLVSFTALALLVMLIEGTPELIVLPFLLAQWSMLSLGQHWQPWQQIIGYSLVCLLTFAAQFIWSIVPGTATVRRRWLYTLLAFGGQTVVVLASIAQGGLFASSGVLAHVSAGALAVLVALLCWFGATQSIASVRRLCLYAAGLLGALVVSWELAAFGQTHIELLSLVPATYLIVVAPFLARDGQVLQHRALGQLCSIAGALLLLLPTLWLSFSQHDLLPALLLIGEALALFLLGIGTRIRIFVLSGAALVIVGVIHTLFLQTLSVPPFVALTITGGFLLAVATALSLARHRLQTIWKRLE